MNGLIYKNQVTKYSKHHGEARFFKGNYDKAVVYNKDTQKIIKNMYHDQSSPYFADLCYNLVVTKSAKGQHDRAIMNNKLSLEIKYRIYPDEHNISFTTSLNNLGKAYFSKGDYDVAIFYYEKTRKIYEHFYSDQPNLCFADLLHNLGLTYCAKKQYDQAILCYEQSLQMKKLIFQNDLLNNLGLTSAKVQYEKAITCDKESLIMNKVLYKNKPNISIAKSLNGLGEIYYFKREYDMAIYYFEKSLKMSVCINKDDLSLNYLGKAYRAIGRFVEANKFQSGDFNKISGSDDCLRIENVTNSLIKTALLFSEKYSLNPQLIVNKIFRFALEGLDFTDYSLHFNYANTQYCNDSNHDAENTQNIIEDFKLALIFLPKADNEIRSDLFNKIGDLLKIDYKVIELWLAEAECNIIKIQELIYDNVDLVNVPLMNNDCLDDIMRIKSIRVFRKQYEEFINLKTDDQQIQFIKNMALQQENSDRCNISKIYASSILLKFAVNDKDMEIVKRLLKLGADPRLKNPFSATTSIGVACLEESAFLEVFLQEVISVKYKLVNYKAPFDGSLHIILKIIQNYKNRKYITQMLLKLYDFDEHDIY